MSEAKTTDSPEARAPGETRRDGRLLALDLGRKRVGVAVSDESRLVASPLAPLYRTNWKQLLRDVTLTLRSFDARGLVIGLPLNMDGSEGPAAEEARRLAGNFEKSLDVPVYLQDERLTSRAAEEQLRAAGRSESEVRALLDSEAAAIILRDFLARRGSSEDSTEDSGL